MEMSLTFANILSILSMLGGVGVVLYYSGRLTSRVDETLREHSTRLAGMLEQYGARFEQHEARLARHEARLEQHEARFERHDKWSLEFREFTIRIDTNMYHINKSIDSLRDDIKESRREGH